MRNLAPLTLRIYLTPTGEWTGRLFSHGEEIAEIAACASPQKVEQAAEEAGFYPDYVRIVIL